MGLESKTIQDAIEQWSRARRLVEDREGQLTRAKELLANSSNKLATLILPVDAQFREVFQMWVHDPATDSDRVIVVTCLSGGHQEGSCEKSTKRGDVFWRPAFKEPNIFQDPVNIP